MPKPVIRDFATKELNDLNWCVDTINGLVLSGGGGVWGTITGTLSDQIDLQAALDAKGGPFLSNHIARVDPSGDDSTGTIEDLTKPFLTVQAAITKAEGLGMTDLFVEVGNNYFNEDITTSLLQLDFRGADANRTRPFHSLTFTEPTQRIDLGLCSCSPGYVTAATSNDLSVVVENIESGDFTNSAGAIFVTADVGSSIINNVTAAGTVTLVHLAYIATVSSPGFTINLEGCIPRYAVAGDYNGAATIDSAGSEVFATHSVINTVTAAGTLHLVDSRVIGTNNATSTVYADVLLGNPLSRFGNPSHSALQVLRANVTNDGFEFADPSGGTGDTSTNTSVSVDSEFVLFSGTSGKLLKRATGSGILKAVSGVYTLAVAATDYTAVGAVGSSGLTMSTARLLGRSTAATGPIEEIVLGSGLSFSGTTLNSVVTAAPSTTDLLAGDGAGAIVDSTIAPANVALLNAANAFTNLNTITISANSRSFPLIAKNSSAGGSAVTAISLRNNQNSAARSLDFGYSGSGNAGQTISGGTSGETGYIVTTGAFPLVIGVNNAPSITAFNGGGVTIGSNSGLTPGVEMLRVDGGHIFGGATASGGRQAGLELDSNGTGNHITLTTTGGGRVIVQNGLILNNETASSFVETDASKKLTTKTAAQMRTDMAVAHLTSVPATSSSAGTVGDWAFNGSFIYVCPTTNTWFRSAVVTW